MFNEKFDQYRPEVCPEIGKKSKDNEKYTLTGGVPGNPRVDPKTYSLPGQVSRGKCNLT